jgi:putative membrane protein
MLFATLAFTLPSCDRSDSETNTEKDAEKRNEEKFAREGERDADFVVDAYTDGMIEIRMAERVKGLLVTQDAKNVADMMITEHTAMNNDLRALATKKQISLPTELTRMQQDDIDDVADEAGINVDQEYLDKAVSMHRDAVDHAEKASSKANDTEVQSAFAAALPKLRSHLDMAKTARDRVNEQDKNYNKNTNKNIKDENEVGGRR